MRRELKEDKRWLQNFTNRLIANTLVRLLAKTDIRPNHLTALSLILVLPFSFLLFLKDTLFCRVVASLILFSSLVLDSADGQLARLKDETSILGDWVDKISDRLKEALVITSITFLLYIRTGNNIIWLLGFYDIFLINFAYYNLEILKKNFNFKRTAFPPDNLLLRNLLSFGYGERMIYLAIFISLDKLFFVLFLFGAGITIHVIVNSYRAIKRGEN